jgi:glycolate oxidase
MVASATIKNLAKELAQVVGRQHVLLSDVDLSVYESDGETLDSARPDLVVLPASTEQVQSVVRLANKYGVPFAPRGAGTGLSGGATTIFGGISLVLTRMSRILKIDEANLSALVEVGATNMSVTHAAAKFNLYFAPDPSSQYASTIGGNLAENAGGAHTLKYGMTTDHVLSVKAVLPNGDIVTLGGDGGHGLGLDLLSVFVGSEGTLGVACEALLKLTPLPSIIETVLAYFPSLEAGGQAVSDIVADGVIPAAMEMIDKLSLNAVEDAFHLGLNRQAGAALIVELDGDKAGIAYDKDVVVQCLQANGVIDLKWAADAKQRQAIWKARKSAFGALGRIAPHGYVLDGVIPRSKLKQAISRIDEITQRHKLQVSNIYHAGDGNLHPCMLFHRDNEEEVKHVMLAANEILELCLELGGTLSGEHGIGIEKLSEMNKAFSEFDLKAMADLHDVFNPDGICNPGKVIPNLKTCGESGIRPLLRHQISALC